MQVLRENLVALQKAWILLIVKRASVTATPKKHVLELQRLFITGEIDWKVQFGLSWFLLLVQIGCSMIIFLLHFNILFEIFLFSLEFNSKLIELKKASSALASLHSFDRCLYLFYLFPHFSFLSFQKPHRLWINWRSLLLLLLKVLLVVLW